MLLLLLAEDAIQLVPDGTLFLHIAIILFMIYVLNRTLFKPVNRILAEREQQTRGKLSSAQGTMRDVEDKLTQYERSLREARAEGYRLLEQEHAAALNERQGKLTATREEIAQSVEAEKTAIRAQATEAQTTLEGDARRAAAQISTQLLRRPGNNFSSPHAQV